MASRGLGLERLLVAIVAIAIGAALSGCGLSLNPRASSAPTEVGLAPTPAPTEPAATPSQTQPPSQAPETTQPPSRTPAPRPTTWLPGGSPLAPTHFVPSTPQPTAAPTAAPTVAPTTAPTSPPTTDPTPRPSPRPTQPPSGGGGGGGGGGGVTTGNARATRIVISALNIDLAVIKGDPSYPKCNVAQYMDWDVFGNPGRPGSTYIYGHARKGMFLPLLDQSKINNGARMIGMTVRVYTRDLKMHTYVINIVKRHATDFSLALNLKPGQHRLVLQTSEGPKGTVPKLQVAAKPTGVYPSTAAAALPTPRPVRCN